MRIRSAKRFFWGSLSAALVAFASLIHGHHTWREMANIEFVEHAALSIGTAISTAAGVRQMRKHDRRNRRKR